MRGRRAKHIRQWAVTHPSFIQTGWVGGTLVYGGWMRSYRDAKRRWKSMFHMEHK